MANKMGVVISALITLVLFVGIPYLLPDYIPQEWAAQIEESGFDIEAFSQQLMTIGVATAALTLIGGFVDPTSVIALIVKIAQAGFSLILIVAFLGAGDLANLGYTTFDIAMEGAHTSIAMDLRVFVYISIASVLLKILQAFLEWNEARIAAAPPGRIAP